MYRQKLPDSSHCTFWTAEAQASNCPGCSDLLNWTFLILESAARGGRDRPSYCIFVFLIWSRAIEVAIMRTQTVRSAKLYFLKSLINALKKATVQPATHHSKYYIRKFTIEQRWILHDYKKKEADSRSRLARQLLGIFKAAKQKQRCGKKKKKN